MNPDIILPADDTGEPIRPIVTEFQKWLWGCYVEDMQAVREFAGRDRLLIVHVGDICQGNRVSHALVTPRLSDQVEIAVGNTKQWPRAERIFLVIGTDPHELDEMGTLVNLVAARIRNAEVVSHLLLDIEGCLVDIAHHGPQSGIRFWTRGNVARLYAQSVIMNEVGRGCAPPRILLRAHYHNPVHETVRVGQYMCDMISLPSYSGMSPYGRKMMQSAHLLGVGCLAFEVINGEVGRWLERTHWLDLRIQRKV